MTLPLSDVVHSRSVTRLSWLGLRISFFELHRADVAQRRVNPAMVVERQPGDDLVHRLALRGGSFACIFGFSYELRF